MRLRLDPWAVEYNTAYHAESSPEAREGVDVRCECAAWHPIRPTRAETLWRDLFFLDGSRRIEARVLLEEGAAQIAFGALGSYGVGVVSCCARGGRAAAFLGDSEALFVKRVCALSSGQSTAPFTIAATLSCLGALDYTVLETGERDADAVIRRVQQEMLAAEKTLASRLLSRSPEALVICDGPRPLVGGEPNVVGYLKTIFEPKVGERELNVVRALEQGERSPLYLVTTRDPEHSYFEWFVRLRDPRPWLYSLAGMVRLQAYAGPNYESRLAWAQNLADWSCLTLPRFASRQHQDPRAPQQLLPIRALERELSRRMGSAQVIRRRVMRHLSQEVQREAGQASAVRGGEA
jgi:hypothetical protein